MKCEGNRSAGGQGGSVKVQRIREETHPLFSGDVLRRGLAFLVDEAGKEVPYSFTFKGHHLAEISRVGVHVKDVIDTFLFYAGHVSKIVDHHGTVVYVGKPVAVEAYPLRDIGVSQFYVSSRKVSAVNEWIEDPLDIVVPVARIHGKIVAADGHTRLKVAQMKGFSHVYGYVEPTNETLESFYYEARLRNIWSIADVTIVSPGDFQVKWYDFCDVFLANKT